MRTRKLVVGAALAAFVAAGAFAADVAPVGREIARDGARTSIQGELVQNEGEWFVRDGSELIQLHMGPYGYASADALALERNIAAQGFAIEGHMAPIQLSGASGELDFWHEARYPLWAGEGERRNAVDERLGRDGVRNDEARAMAFGRSDVETTRRAEAAQTAARERQNIQEAGRRSPRRR